MQITPYGAAREVTGSMHLLTTDKDRVLLDCGLHQGRRQEATEKNRVMPLDPALVTSVVLSHAHIDHSGRLPLLGVQGFSGRILCTRATAGACEYLLPDAGHIQESDAEYLNYKSVRNALAERARSPRAKALSSRRMKEIKGSLKLGPHKINKEALGTYGRELNVPRVEPLYTQQDAERILRQFEGIPYGQETEVGKGIFCRFEEAGHILGSAQCLLRIQEGGRTRRVIYSGDMGRFGMPILRDPFLQFSPEEREPDLLLMESTYGDREHGPRAELKPLLRSMVEAVTRSRGTLLIPAFAFGRTQLLLYFLHELYKEGAVKRLPVTVDSPLATRLTRVFGEHPEVYDKDARLDFLSRGLNPFDFPELRFVESVEESMELSQRKGAQIVIAASGMCEAGRILHHLRYRIHDSRTLLLLVGYMAEHTLGRRLEDLADHHNGEGRGLVKILGKEYPVRARIEKIDGFSAHGDRNDLLRYLKEGGLRPKRIALVHGEEAQSQAFADTLRGLGHTVVVPRRGESLNLD
ncbi:MAG: MBL fold metallo-hydrolase [Candidatus Delongbacteria bacterium]|nr:MBL fold metallo-hydrolase [Candidatus Delongbacteria bacterium]